MKVTYEGEAYELAFDDITVAQASVIKNRLGFTIKGMEDGLAENDIDAVCALYWLMMAQAGRDCDIDNVDFKILKFTAAYAEALDYEHDVRMTSEARLIAARIVRPRKAHPQDINRVRWLNADVDTERGKYLFDLAHVCGISAREVDNLRYLDFANYCQNIDQYWKNEKAKFEAQMQAH